MSTKPQFVFISRVIDPKTRIHYLDALDAEGKHYTAQMSPNIETWLCFTEPWREAPR